MMHLLLNFDKTSSFSVLVNMFLSPGFCLLLDFEHIYSLLVATLSQYALYTFLSKS